MFHKFFGIQKLIDVGCWRKGVSGVAFINFCLKMPKIFGGKPSCVSQTFFLSKMLGIREGRISRFSVKIVFRHSTGSFRRGTILCFKKFRLSKVFTPKMGISRFSKENLLSQSPIKQRRKTLVCITKILVSKNLLDKRGRRRVREYHDFMSKTFVLECQEKS